MGRPARSGGFGLVLLLAAILCLIFLSRAVFSPLLLRIERDLDLSHAEGAALFLLLSAGYGVSMLFSGFVSRRLLHRRTILLACVLTAFMLFLVAASSSLLVTRALLVLLGLGAGIYLPSGIALIYAHVHRERWGLAIGIHELGPNTGLILAPLLSQLLAPAVGWRGVLVILGAASLALGLAFTLSGWGGSLRGEPPNLRNVRFIVRRPSYAAVLVAFCIVAASSLGSYSIFPVFLVSERAFTEARANLLVGLSRLSGPAMVFLTGWLLDRIDTKVFFRLILLAIGVFTLLVGVTRGALLTAVVVLQPVATAAFFPAAFTVIARVTPAQSSNVAVSLVVFCAYVFGAGVVPAVMGILGERGLFSLGFVLIGGLALTVLGSFLLMDQPRPES